MGDHEEWLAGFSDAGCAVKEHPKKYRSVHYLLRSAGSRAPTAVELQVRTVFEEAWSEIDHRVNYPQAAPYAIGVFLEIFNRLAGSADEMGSFIHSLLAELTHLSSRADAAEEQRKTAAKQVDDLIEKLEISSTERKALKREIAALRKSDTSIHVGGPDLLSSIVTASAPVKGYEVLSGGIVSFRRSCKNCGYEPPPNVFFATNKCPICSGEVSY